MIINHFKKFKIICFFIIFFHLFSVVLTPFAESCNTGCWWGGGQQPTSDPANAPANPPDGEEPPQEPNENPCEEGDPVYLHSRQFYYECSSLHIPGRGIDINFTHTFKSGKEFDNQFGYGWSLNYYGRIKVLENGNALILSGHGRKDEYTYNSATNSYTSPEGFFEVLKSNPNGTWTLTDQHQDKKHFDINGNLNVIEDRNGNKISFTYDPAGLFPIVGVSEFTQNSGESVVISYDYRLTKVTDTVGRVINLTYNNDGRLDKIADFAGREVLFDYDPYTKDLLKITYPKTKEFPNGIIKSFTYYPAHLLETIIDGKNQAFVKNYYDSKGLVTKQDLGYGSYTFFSPSANVTTVTDRKGFVTTYTFNATGQMIKKEEFTQGIHVGDPASFVTTYTYNDNGLLTSVKYPKGNGVKYIFDESNPNLLARGNLLESRQKQDMAVADNDLNDIVVKYTYESQFNSPSTITDAKGNITTFTYDYQLPTNDPKYGTKGNVVRITQPAVNGQNPITEFTYNSYGQPIQIKDPNQNSIALIYDSLTSYLKQIRQDPVGINATTNLEYDAFGLIDKIIDPKNSVIDYDYNEMGWLVKSKDPLGFATKYTHDANGNVIKIDQEIAHSQQEGPMVEKFPTSNPSGPTTSISGYKWQTTLLTYDILNNLKTMTDPLKRVNKWTYDNNENVVAIEDAENNVTVYDYDERDFLFRVKDANTPQGITVYDYDINGNLKKITDANSNPTNYVYDLFDRMNSTIYADNKNYTAVYDKNSNLTDYTTPNGPIKFVYDALNRLTDKQFPAHASLNTQYVYDVGGRLTDANIVGNGVKNHFVYDELNRLKTNMQIINGVSYALNYVCDVKGQVTKIVYPSGKVIDYSYDELSLLTTVSVDNKLLAKFNHDSLHRRTSKIFNPKSSIVSVNALPTIETTYSYDLGNQLKELETRVNSSVLSQYKYPTHDKVGNRKQIDFTFGNQPAQTTNYSYNDIYELTTTTGAQNHNFTYDNVANRKSVDGVNYVPNNVHQYLTVGSKNFNYDPNGNLVSDGTNTYTYDETNRLTTAQSPTANAQYEYDAFSRRVAKIVNGVKTYYIHDRNQVVGDYSSNNLLKAEYVYGDRIDEVLLMDKAGQRYYFQHDGLGSVSEVTDRHGNLLERYTYDVFGKATIYNENNQLLSTSAIGNRYMFTGREFDAESGLYHYRARMYDPQLGRFIQKDPIGYYDSMNLYQYVYNSPINYTDSFGLQSPDPRIAGLLLLLKQLQAWFYSPQAQKIFDYLTKKLQQMANEGKLPKLQAMCELADEIYDEWQEALENYLAQQQEVEKLNLPPGTPSGLIGLPIFGLTPEGTPPPKSNLSDFLNNIDVD